ncbi:MAG: hypothetical protein M1376_22220 [Planctomycetes bacterium]|nr:hypothetical protein [Planctomycetota bacterium]
MERVESTTPEVAELSAAERQDYETLVTGFREAQRGQNAIWRQEKMSDLLAKMKAGADHEVLWHNAFLLERLLHPTARMKTSAKVLVAALETAIAEVRETLDPADELKKMEGDIRLAILHLGPKAKTIMGVLEEISGLDGLNIGIEFGQQILREDIEDYERIDQSCKELADDPDIKIMARAHELAVKIEGKER